MLGTVVHNNIRGSIPALLQSFELSSLAEHYGAFYEHRPEDIHRIYGVSEDWHEQKRYCVAKDTHRETHCNIGCHDLCEFGSLRDKNHMASDRVNVEVMRNRLYREALCSQSIGRVQGCSTNHVLRDASEAVHHLAAK
ncbi:hypothetical protein TNCV_2478401 [Trichonephila clavipes]|nr:hypothetical protein TNCV_2478401 [Trichonephila clavipes]